MFNESMAIKSESGPRVSMTPGHEAERQCGVQARRTVVQYRLVGCGAGGWFVLRWESKFGSHFQPQKQLERNFWLGNLISVTSNSTLVVLQLGRRPNAPALVG